jgi:hypothetical protein
LNDAGSSYAAAEATNVSPLQTVEDDILAVINAPTEFLFQRPLIGNGTNGAPGTGQAGGGGGISWGQGGTGGSGVSGTVTTAAGPGGEGGAAIAQFSATPGSLGVSLELTPNALD